MNRQRHGRPAGEAARLDRLNRLRRLSRILDSAIPLPGGYRIGMDGIVGLIPGLGDTIGSAFSGYIILEAARLGASTPTLFRMVLNVLLESVVGIVPVAGDLFDFAWKANEKNVRLLETQLDRPPPDSSAERRLKRVAIGLLVLMVGGVLALSWGAIELLLALARALGGG